MKKSPGHQWQLIDRRCLSLTGHYLIVAAPNPILNVLLATTSLFVFLISGCKQLTAEQQILKKKKKKKEDYLTVNATLLCSCYCCYWPQ